MGYNGNNRKLKTDVFPKRKCKSDNLVGGLLAGLILAPFAIMGEASKYANDAPSEPVSKTTAVVLIVIGILLTPLFIPLIGFACDFWEFPFVGALIFFSLVFIPLVVWGGILYLVIEAFSNNNQEVCQKNDLSMPDSQYDRLINIINNENPNNKHVNIRKSYYEIVKVNQKLERKKEELEKDIENLNKRLESIFSLFFKKKWADTIFIKEKELKEIKKQIQKPTIKVNIIPSKSSNVDVEGEVFLIINDDFEEKTTLDIDSMPHFEKSKTHFFSLNEEANISIKFKEMEFCFWEDKLLLMTETDFAIIDKDIVHADFSVSLFHCRSSKYRFPKKTIGLIFYNEVGVLKISISSQKIHLLFNNLKDGEKVYKLIQTHNIAL